LAVRRYSFPCAIISLLLLALAGNALAQVAAHLQRPIDDTQLVQIPHSTHPLASAINEAGRVESGKKLDRVLLLLSSSDAQKADLQKFLADLHNPKSSVFHHWLTPAQFGARFGVADEDIQKVTSWLQSKGLVPGKISQSKLMLEFSGTSAQVEAAFHTELHYYLVGGTKYVANSVDISLPAGLAAISPGVASLNNFPKLRPRQIFSGIAGRNSQGRKVKNVSPDLTAVSNGTFTNYLAPGDFSTIYSTASLLAAGNDGTGITIAITAQSNIELTDVQMFRQMFGLKPNDPNVILSGPDPGVVYPVDGNEATLDTEWAGAVAPGATIDLVVAGTTATTNGVDLAAVYVVDNQLAPIISYTYGTCEQNLGTAGNAFYSALWQQAEAQGMTVLTATGDSGAAACDSNTSEQPAMQGLAVNGTASTPYTVAVGGTQFAEGANASTYWSASNDSTFTSALGYIPEAAWNESCDPGQPSSATNCIDATGNFSLLATGGGASAIYTKPSWQSGPGVPADGQRDIPDVSLAASSGHDQAVYCTSLGGTACQINGQQEAVGLTLVGGTSLSTPAMAGVVALVEQKNGAFQGQIDYVLYQLAQTNSCNSSRQTTPGTSTTCIFYDITTGNNSVPCAGGSPNCSSTQAGTNGVLTGEDTSTGYDMATGLGSVNVANLANAWSSVTLVGSQVSLQAANMSFVHGTPVTLTGAVTPASGTSTPTGTVALRTDSYGNMPDTMPLTTGAYMASISDMPGGQYNLYAHYSGDGTFAPSDSAGVALNVTPESSATSLSLTGLSSGAAAYGSNLSVVIKVSGQSGQGVATGIVTLTDGSSTIGTFPLASDGEVTDSTGAGTAYSFPVGMHSLVATYSGDNSFLNGTSNTVSFTIGQGTPFVVVGVNSNTASAGQTVGVHAVVAGFGSVSATGAVQFTDNGTNVGTAQTLQTIGFFGTQAQASLLLTNLMAGQHVIGATYLPKGDPNYTGVMSGDPQNELTQTIQVSPIAGTKTTTTLSSTATPANLGDTATFSVAVKPASATGTVTLWDAVGPRSSAAPLSGGAASISIAWPQGGTTSVYAVYSGDSNDASSASAPLSFTVNRGTPQVALVAPSILGQTQQVTLNATVTGNPGDPLIAYPTGFVEFWDSVNGAPAKIINVQSLTAGAGDIGVFAFRFTFASGTHALHVHYRGDNNWQPADSAVVTIATSDFGVTIAPNPLSIAGGSAGSATVSIAPLAGFTGAVNLTCATGGTAPPVGYTCSLASSVSVGTGTATTPLNLAVSSAASGNRLPAAGNTSASASLPWTIVGFAGVFLLIGGLFSGIASPQAPRHFFASAGVLLLVSGLVWGCGGGGGGSGGGGGGPVPTTTTISSSNAKIGFGMPLQFNVTVNGNATPSGKVQLYDNGQPYSTQGTVNAGIAVFNVSSLPVGVHSISAHYLGDSGTEPSNSAPITQVITGGVPLQITAASSSGLTHTANVTVTIN
jgi:Pro-kumamolisin, activation domain/Bacterial Ig-like domain (group 3)